MTLNLTALPRLNRRRLLANRYTMWAAGYALYPSARVGQRLRSVTRRAQSCRVAHVSPCYFDENSLIGGGERYAMWLAEAMSCLVDTVFISFGERRARFEKGSLRVEIFPALT